LERIPGIEADLRNLSERLSGIERRHENEIAKLESRLLNLHEENRADVQALETSQRQIVAQLDKIAGGVIVARSTAHALWLVLGVGLSVLGQWLMSVVKPH
jgi:hypothetical protein